MHFFFSQDKESKVDIKSIFPLNSFAVNVNIVDEDQKRAIQSYDPQAPVTRKGVLRSLRTGRPIEIREEDLVGLRHIHIDICFSLI